MHSSLTHSVSIFAILIGTLGVRSEAADRPQSADKAGSTQPAALCREVDGGLELVVRGRPVLKYNTAVVQPPAGADPVFKRSGHIHPVYTPDGRVLTSEFPADHYHQHGIYRAWVNTTFEGRKVDFWNQARQAGDIEHVKTLSTKSGDDYAEFVVELRHSDLAAPGGAKPVLKEVWTVRAWNVAEGFLFDIESRQTCVADSPLVLNEYHYGGMAFRGSDQWFAGDKDQPGNPQTDFEFLTSEGKKREEGNHTRPNWVLAHGTLEGRPAGIAIMGHPENFRHPEPVRLHPTKPYFVFSAPVLGKFTLEPGVEHVDRYRYFIPGDAEAATIDGMVQGAERVWQELRAGKTQPAPLSR